MSSRLSVSARVLLAILLGLLCGVAVACTVVLVGSSGAAPLPVRAPTVAAPGPTTHRAREVLRAWDDARAAAWASGDTVALRRLYVTGSVAGARDVAMLVAWNRRGRRVTTLTTQVLRLSVVRVDRRRLVLVVTDRLTRVESGADVLPRDRTSTRRIELRRTDSEWRVAAVSARPDPTAAPS